MKIWVGGGVGHGKSTLASRLAKEFKLSILDLDTIVYKDNFGNKYSEQETAEKLNKFIKKNNSWIIEGAQKRAWCEAGFKKADVVLVLKINKCASLWRFLKRQVKLMAKIEHQRGRWLTKIKWIWFYERDDFPKYLNLVKKHSKKCLIIRNNKELEKAIDYVKKRRKAL